jgi:small subunit ribosomal protein S16
MAVHIRLARGGAKKTPFYRVVVTDSRSPRGGRFLESVGIFNPLKEGPAQLDLARIAYWQSVGAQASDTVARLVAANKKAAAAG